ncbi:venom carboxylesterase-6-like [Aphidius gifuensis]|uniref:venom carboxylesterase-6-like n=1 Tax=Aphidius gifuensis TaxID=684658 RepID=UPI001CDC1280|nr:venom carboxylesterase-6-like [Aphidius gifuensis]
MSSVIFKLLIVTIWACSILINASPIVKIKNGTLEGSIMKSKNGRNFYSFRGIPYALPPIGELRFKSPKPATSWKGTRSAKKDADMCIQVNSYQKNNLLDKIIGSEDCLYLNVYTPELPTLNTENISKKYPVMIWIHGGGWLEGSGHSDCHSPIYFLDHDIVLVTINYRLGPLGFLSTQDIVSPGNYGMKDQVQSIRWVKENIDAFGGDPNSVTLFGESAGGASIHYHMMSPLAKDLFHRGISQSGTALSSWAFNNEKTAIENANKLGKYLNCPISNSENLIACLKNKNASDIMDTDSIFKIFSIDPIMPFRVVIEPKHPGAFLTEDPVELIKNGQVRDTPWMTGITSHEGAPPVFFLYNSDDLIKSLNDKWQELAPTTLMYQQTHDEKYHNEMAKKIRKFYLKNKIIDDSSKSDLIDMYSDFWENFGTHLSVKYHLKHFGSSVFYYEFSYRGKTSLIETYGSKENYGVSHTDDLMYLFPLSKLSFSPDIKQSEEDQQMIDVLTNIWCNFAKHGNPTPVVTKQLPNKWKPVRTEDLEFFLIKNPENMFMSKNFNKKRMKFLENLPFRKLNDRVKDEL